MKIEEEVIYNKITTDNVSKYDSILFNRQKVNIKFLKKIDTNKYCCKETSISLKSFNKIITLSFFDEKEKLELILFSFYMEEEPEENNFLKKVNEKKKNIEDLLTKDENEALNECETLSKAINKTLTNLPDNINSILKKKLQETLKTIISYQSIIYINQKLYRHSIEKDLYILNKLDPLYEPSYERLINTYLKLNDYDNVKLYYNKVNEKFTNEDFIQKLNYVNEILNEQKTMIKGNISITEGLYKDHSSFLINGFLLIASGISMFLLYKYKQKFFSY